MRLGQARYGRGHKELILGAGLLDGREVETRRIPREYYDLQKHLCFRIEGRRQSPTTTESTTGRPEGGGRSGARTGVFARNGREILRMTSSTNAAQYECIVSCQGKSEPKVVRMLEIT
jgi:hypothetical protein